MLYGVGYEYLLAVVGVVLRADDRCVGRAGGQTVYRDESRRVEQCLHRVVAVTQNRHVVIVAHAVRTSAAVYELRYQRVGRVCDGFGLLQDGLAEMYQLLHGPRTVDGDYECGSVAACYLLSIHNSVSY